MNCRLCDESELTIDLFRGDVNPAKLKLWRFYVFITTGLEIRRDDIVSKMVCHTCCELVEKIYKYRINAVANDKALKERLGQVYVPPVTDLEELQRIGEQILTDDADGESMTMLGAPTGTETDPLNKVVQIHDSVNKLMEKYPGIKLPDEINRCDISPDVTLDESEVKDWYEEVSQQIQQKLLTQNIVIRRINNTNHENTYIATCSNVDNDSHIVESDGTSSDTLEQAEESVNHKPITSESASKNELSEQPKPFRNKPCPKSKKVQQLLDTINAQLENSTIAETTEDTSITDIMDEVLKSMEISQTQINHVSTTTAETSLVKKKRKPRKRLISEELASDEVMPQKKKRAFYNKNSLSPTSKQDIPEHIPSNTNVHRELLPSSLGLEPITNPSEPNVEEEFACKICLKLFDTSKQLRDHQKRHLLLV